MDQMIRNFSNPDLRFPGYIGEVSLELLKVWKCAYVYWSCINSGSQLREFLVALRGDWAMGRDRFDEKKPLGFFMVEHNIRQFHVFVHLQSDFLKQQYVYVQHFPSRIPEVQDDGTRCKPRSKLFHNCNLELVMFAWGKLQVPA